MQFSYWNILFFFIVPPILILIIFISVKKLTISKNPYPDHLFIIVILIHVFISLIYTTPWDNYLVAKHIWYYDPTRISGVILGYVPIEEYVFFILQSLLSGLWTWFVYLSIPQPKKKLNIHPKYNLLPFFLLLPAIISIINLLIGTKASHYSSLIFVWAFLPIFIQWLFGLDILLKNAKFFLISSIPVTLYLWIVDGVAITNGVWEINPKYIYGISFFHLPFEEAMFFFLTNVIICGGIILMIDPQSTDRVLSWIRYFQRLIRRK